MKCTLILLLITHSTVDLPFFVEGFQLHSYETINSLSLWLHTGGERERERERESITHTHINNKYTHTLSLSRVHTHTHTHTSYFIMWYNINNFNNKCQWLDSVWPKSQSQQRWNRTVSKITTHRIMNTQPQLIIIHNEISCCDYKYSTDNEIKYSWKNKNKIRPVIFK